MSTIFPLSIIANEFALFEIDRIRHISSIISVCYIYSTAICTGLGLFNPIILKSTTGKGWHCLIPNFNCTARVIFLYSVTIKNTIDKLHLRVATSYRYGSTAVTILSFSTIKGYTNDLGGSGWTIVKIKMLVFAFCVKNRAVSARCTY